VEIVACPTVREADGLAMSSRNRYLSPTEREMASALPAALADSVRRFRSGVVASEELLAPAKTKLEGAGLRVQYLEIVDQETLQPVPQVSEGCRIAAAVFAGSTRLIDNMPFEL
jgi:pantoate--beta-alanine ligase